MVDPESAALSPRTNFNEAPENPMNINSAFTLNQLGGDFDMSKYDFEDRPAIFCPLF